jgi:tRNA A-37 threonylcarbamoyl transferase component Bud32
MPAAYSYYDYRHAAPWESYIFGLFNGLISPLAALVGSISSSSAAELHDAMVATIGPAIALSAALGALSIAVAVANRRKLIEVRKEGLVVQNKGATYGLFVPWEFLEKVDVLELPDWFGRKNYRLALCTDDGVRVNFTWEEVVASEQAPLLLNALKTWAPEALAASDLPALESEDTTTDYTQLWLQYFSAPARRERSTFLEPGATVYDGKYAVAGRLSGGGHGTTYLAVERELDGGQPTGCEQNPGEVVLKEYVLPVHRSSAVLEHTINKLKAEADILRRIDHPQIVRLLDSFIEDFRGYLVMEYVSGVSLKDLVERQGPQPEDVVCRLAVQMCDILDYLHGLTPPIVHRDFTPDNLILQDDLKLKLVDFNVAHELEASKTATVVGKHAYIPPEQFRGKPLPQSDIYALGCTMFYLLTAQEPEPITQSDPRHHRPDSSENVATIIKRATDLDPSRRYANAAEMRAEIAPQLR